MDEKKGSPKAEVHLDHLLQIEQTCNSISLNWTSVKSLGTGPYTIKTMWKAHRGSFSYFPTNPVKTVEQPWTEIHFLIPSCVYKITVEGAGNFKPLERIVKLKSPFDEIQNVSKENWANLANYTSYVGPEHKLGEWLAEADGDFMWCSSYDYKFWVDILWNGMFMLPSWADILTLPNPKKRYCLKISDSLNFLRAKKVKKLLKNQSIRVSVEKGQNLKNLLRKCQKYHIENNRGSWLNADQIKLLVRMSLDDVCGIYMRAIVMWREQEILAANFGYGVGCTWCEYSAMTLVRNKCSYGSCLNRIVGNVLQIHGYDCWWWGIRIPYFQEYDKYGGEDIAAKDFWKLFKVSREKSPRESFEKALKHNKWVIPSKQQEEAKEELKLAAAPDNISLKTVIV